jgi:hypothetical protein
MRSQRLAFSPVPHAIPPKKNVAAVYDRRISLFQIGRILSHSANSPPAAASFTAWERDRPGCRVRRPAERSSSPGSTCAPHVAVGALADRLF